MLVAVILGSCSPATLTANLPTQTPLEESPISNWETYTSETFLVTLKYPEYWTVDHTGNAVYSGQDGFFQLTASSMGWPTAKEACENVIQVN